MEKQSKKKILIVDEDTEFKNQVKKELRSQGCKVNKEHYITEASERIKQIKPDVVVLNLAMENQAGIQFFRKLRKTYPYLPLITFFKSEKFAQPKNGTKRLLSLETTIVNGTKEAVMQAVEDRFRLEDVFDEKIKPELGKPDIGYVNVEYVPAPENIMKKRKNSTIELIEFTYKDGDEYKTYYAISKKARKKDIKHERRIYNFSRKTPVECFVELYDYSDTQLTLQFANKVETLEDKLLEWRFKEGDPDVDEETKNKIQAERKDELTKVIKEITKMQFHLTVELFQRYWRQNKSENIKERNFELVDEHDEKWTLEYKKQDNYKGRFVSYLIKVCETKAEQNSKGVNLDTFKKDLEKIVYEFNEEGKKDIFDWVDTKLELVIHGDMHPGQIPYREEKGEVKVKIVDLKNVKFGPGILDFSFLQSPVYNYETEDLKAHLYQTYLDELEKLQDESQIHLVEIEGDWRTFRRDDKLRQVYWNARISDKICRYDKDSEREDRLNKHLEYSKTSLNNFINDFGEEYPQAKMLYALLEKYHVF